MSGNIWKLSDQIDDMDVEMLRHDFITLREGMEYYQNMKQWYIAIGVAIVYLAISIVFKAWPWSWIIWVGYAVYRFTESRKAHG